MKKALSMLLTALLCVVLAVPVLAVPPTRDLTQETALAEQLKTLGLFMGVKENKDGTSDFALDRPPTRTEAVVMLLRAIGKETEAQAQAKTHPFSDVPAWANGYVSYAYEKGLTKGVSDKRFGAQDAVSADMYLTFLLRALGYKEGEQEDFPWDFPQALASYCGMLPPQVDQQNFLRADVATLTAAALYAKCKESEEALHERLEKESVFTAEQFAAAFPSDPFEDYRRLDEHMIPAIATRLPIGPMESGELGLNGNNGYGIACYVIGDVEQVGELLRVSALVFERKFDINETGTISGGGGGSDLWQLDLDANSLELVSIRTAGDLRAEELDPSDYFSEKSLALRDRKSETYGVLAGMSAVSGMQVQEAVAKGFFNYQKLSYEEVLTKAKDALSEAKILEAPSCTILLGKEKGHDFSHLVLVYKPGSAVGEGKTQFISLADTTGQMHLSGDGMTLYYVYYDAVGGMPGAPPHGPSEPQPDNYQYTIDLNTGNNSWGHATAS